MRGWETSHIEKLKARGMVVNANPVIKNPDHKLLKQVRAKMKFTESDLQINCVETFRLIYPRLKMRLFMIPNAGYRNAIQASIMHRQGSLPGISDLMLAIPKNGYGGLFIEIKTATGKLSEYQKRFIEEMGNDYRCIVVSSVEEFLYEVKNYLR